MSIEARLRVSLSTGEVEIEGTEAFVAQYDAAIQEILQRLAEAPVAIPAARSDSAQTGEAVASPAVPAQSTDAAPALPEFGEALHRLPKGTSGTDQILIAGYYAASRNADRTFATGDASKLLIEQGIKLPNPSQSLKNNMDAKKVFKTGKHFKLSREGNDRVSYLLGNAGI
jgi:hypothetical protein